MKRQIIAAREFTKTVDALIAKNKLLAEDFLAFFKSLIEDPKQGDIIPGTSGIRKVRLKSASKGKSGGFRVCYLDLPESEMLYLLYIYPKNEKEDLSSTEKSILKEAAITIKSRFKNS